MKKAGEKKKKRWVSVIVAENGIGDPSSNPRQDWLDFTLR